MMFLLSPNTEITFVTYITKVLIFLVEKPYQDNCYSLHINIISKVHFL